jgi:hypothetical protein
MSNHNPEFRGLEVFFIFPHMSIINLSPDKGRTITKLKNYYSFASEMASFRHVSSFGVTHSDHTALSNLMHGDASSLELFVHVQDMQPSCKRIIEYKHITSALEQELNTQIQISWCWFDHCAKNLLAYESQVFLK